MLVKQIVKYATFHLTIFTANNIYCYMTEENSVSWLAEFVLYRF